MNYAFDKKRLFVAWTQISRRSEELSKNFDAKYIRYNRFDYPWPKRIASLLLNFIKSCKLLYLEKPTTVFTFHTHPLVTLCAILIKTMRPYKIIADLHTAAYTDYYRFPFKSLIKFTFRFTDLLLIHNRNSINYFEKYFSGYSDKLFFLEDPVPEIIGTGKSKDNPKIEGKTICVLITRFSDDEKVMDFLNIVKDLENYFFYITGNYKKINIGEDKRTGYNYHMTGFLDENDYWQLLDTADIIVTLTTREYTLLSAGYEAIALEKPILVSETITLKDFFGENARYLNQDFTNVVDELDRIVNNIEHWQQRVKRFKQIRQKEWKEKAKLLLTKYN